MTARTETRQSVEIIWLLRAAHIGPTLAVTGVVGLLAAGADLTLANGIIVTAAAFTGQLTVGWGNDLLDAARDRQAGRQDKPLANGELSAILVRRCLILAAALCVVLSMLVGWRSGLTHLMLGVAFGHLYNFWFKATAWSWLPYAVAFGILPAAVTLAGQPPEWPPTWMMVTAVALGVAAHFLNTLPDFEDDERTGIRGLPHRLGATTSRVVATALLLVGSAFAVLGPVGAPETWAPAVLMAVAGLAVLALVGRGKVPFYAAIAIALVDVTLLTLVAP